jgi:hypothetical protein
MKWVVIGGIVILAAFLVVLSFIPLGIEPLTELYFENHTDLQENIFLNKPYNFSFTVHNLEYQKMGYNYTVTAYSSDENRTKLLDISSGSIILEDNESRTIDESFKIGKHFSRMQVVVEIEKDDLGIVPDFKKKLWWPDPNYPTNIDVHFWVDEIVGTTINITRS